MPPLVVGFDLDMTLIDGRPGILATIEALNVETGVPVDGELMISRLGPTLEMELANYFPESEIPPVADRFRELYATLGPPGTVLLPGAIVAVRAVRDAGGRTLVVTAKYGPNAHRCLNHVGLAVDDVVGWRYGTAKGETLREHNAAIYVGDTPADIVGARGAGAVAVMVPSGPSDADELRAAGADVVLDTLFDFPTWLASWLAPPSAASSGAARLATTPGP